MMMEVVVTVEFRIDRRSGVPAFQQIVQQTKQALRLGVLVPGDRLPTAKEVAEVSTVNPNTTLKAYRELEREGLVEPRPGQGTFVRRTLARPETGTDSPLYAELVTWISKAAGAGLEREDVAALVAAAMEKQFAAGTTAATGAVTTGSTGATTTRSTGE
ncbi:GntR family transcriptional regulator [Streptomyces sp. AK08-02]|uniref:GntR family transcriptional regulator n=1 Tax=Streptomyces sp. AK08-02 TaxID=3028654 RepID=UPI0029B456E4|nr:GntR family transcriptional regulator [Streptomyces sp. AK08-02]MDX3752051.1 GntR family transcriptional regulator [Streptomyces sp. AK08-02]